MSKHFQWDDRLSIGSPVVDRQHKALFELVDQLQTAIEERVGHNSLETVVGEMETIVRVLEELAAYTVHHFTAEEQLMADAHYPPYAAHKQVHQAFVDKVRDYQRRLDEGADVPSTELAEFLRDWLKKHIMHVDMRFGAYLMRQAAVGPPRKPLPHGRGSVQK